MSATKVGTAAAASSTMAERRAWVRQACTLDGTCGRISDGMDPRLAARVQDISAGGMALLLKRPFQPGTVLVVKLRGKHPGIPEALFVRVIHVRAQSATEWLTGCAFASPLTEDELQALLS